MKSLTSSFLRTELSEIVCVISRKCHGNALLLVNIVGKEYEY